MPLKTYNPKAIPEFELKQNIKVQKKDPMARRKVETFSGEVVAITKFNVVVQNKHNVRESFKLSDFLTGVVKLL